MTLYGMNDANTYTTAVIRRARWFLRTVGVVLIGASVVAFLFASSNYLWGVALSLIIGIACFVLSFEHRGATVANTARDVIDTDPLP